MAYYAVRNYNRSALQKDLLERVMHSMVGYHCYAFVDSAFDHDGKVIRVPGSEARPLYHQGKLAALSNVSPVLYPLAIDNPELLQRQLSRLLVHCQGRPMLSFIQSKLSISQLFDSWHDLLELETEDQEQYLLRFADTRVLAALANQEAIWNRLSSSLTAWWAIDRLGQLLALAIPTSNKRNEERLKINNECLRHLLAACAVDAMVDYMDKHFPDLLAERDGFANYELLKHTLSLCAEHGLSGTSDQYAFAVATLFTNGQLLADPDISRWLSEKAWDGKGIEDALAEFLENRGIS